MLPISMRLARPLAMSASIGGQDFLQEVARDGGRLLEPMNHAGPEHFTTLQNVADKWRAGQNHHAPENQLADSLFEEILGIAGGLFTH